MLVLGVVLAGLAGCGPGRVNSEISKTLTPNEPDGLYGVPAASSERTIHVEVSATGSDVDVYVVTGAEPEKILNEAHDNRPKKALASKQKFKSGSLDATIPANTEATVIIYLSDKMDIAKGEKREKTQVTGKITSK